MKKKFKFHSIEDFGGADSSHRLFTLWGWESVNSPDEAEIIIFNGGTDIATEMYGETPISPYIPHKRSERDIYEDSIFAAFHGKKFLLGICRGAQFLNVMNGGTLWQDVNNHGRNHDMVDLRTGEVLKVTSTHHQQMRPNLKTGQLIGVSNECTVKRAQGVVSGFNPKNTEPKDGPDVEIVWYPGTTSLCIQGHPEYVPGSRFAEYTKELLLSCWAMSPQLKKEVA